MFSVVKHDVRNYFGISRNMATTLHTKFAALSHPNRLDIFRLLMRRFPDALPAGQVARVLNFPASTPSTYLSALRQAGLIEQYRSGTSLQ